MTARRIRNLPRRKNPVHGVECGCGCVSEVLPVLTPSWFVRPLRESSPPMTGPDVEKVQRKLRVVEDGFGPMTAAKVRGFAWMVNVDSDGSVDAEIARKLGE